MLKSGAEMETGKHRVLPLAIVGPGNCGKDTAAEWLRDNLGLRFTGGTSSVIAAEVARRDGITVEQALAKRRGERERWGAIGAELCRDDPAALVRVLVPANDVIVGIRRQRELDKAVIGGLVGAILWIDRPGPPDPTLEFGPEYTDLFIPNHRDLGYLFDWLAKAALLLRLDGRRS